MSTTSGHFIPGFTVAATDATHRCQRQDYWPFFAIFNVRYWSLMLSACRHFIITDWRGVFCQHSR
ncbi:hypothetical protein MXM40_27090, partial [Escherichia coli]|nr:hypothetical protein [Escherichia coli]